MTKLRIAIETQKDKIQEISEKFDYFTIKDPIYDTIHMSIICKNQLQEQTKMICEHFYNIEELMEIYKGDYESLKKNLTLILVVFFSFIIISLTIIIVTFSYLENKALSLIPLITLISCTLLICFFVLNVLRLRIINRLISGELIVDRKYIFLVLYRMKKEQLEKKSILGFAEECLSLKDDCLN